MAVRTTVVEGLEFKAVFLVLVMVCEVELPGGKFFLLCFMSSA